MKLSPRRWIVCWGVLGLLVPSVLLLRWLVFDHIFGEVEMILWPSSFVLLALDGPEPLSLLDRLTSTALYAIALAINVGLYSVIGLLSWQLIDLIRRWRISSP